MKPFEITGKYGKTFKIVYLEVNQVHLEFILSHC